MALPGIVAQILEVRRTLVFWMLVAVSARIAVFLVAIIWPIPNEGQYLVSPMLPQSYLDFHFYVESLEKYRNLPMREIFQEFVRFYQRPFDNQFGFIIAGPVFPALLYIFDYGPHNTLPISVFFLVVSCVLVCAWLIWLRQLNVSWIWLAGFSLAPNPVWFTLVLSPDIIFSFLVCIFFLAYSRESQTVTSIAIWSVAVIMILFTRPNGYSILIFVLADYVWNHYRERYKSPATIFGLIILVALFGFYFYPYFITEMRKAPSNLTFFGATAAEYFAGIFKGLPSVLDKFLSGLALAGAKLLYFVGLRPTYGSTLSGLILLRAAAGIILLPGFIYLSFRANVRTRLFLWIFFLPIFLGPTQDRYNLPIFPILFGYGALAYSAGWSILIKSARTSGFGDRP
jgi:hypothetical protein